MQHQNDAARGRRPREHVSRENASSTAGGPGSDDLRVPHPEKPWNISEWRQWDKNHGHMLWMGSVQASGGTGIFLCDRNSSSLRIALRRINTKRYLLGVLALEPRPPLCLPLILPRLSAELAAVCLPIPVDCCCCVLVPIFT